MGLPWWLRGKEPAFQSRRWGFHPWVGKIPWRRKLQPVPIFLPGKSHGQRSLASFSPWGYSLATERQQLIRRVFGISSFPQNNAHGVPAGTGHLETRWLCSLIRFLCILLLEETFVQVQALQQRAPGHSLSQVACEGMSRCWIDFEGEAEEAWHNRYGFGRKKGTKEDSKTFCQHELELGA